MSNIIPRAPLVDALSLDELYARLDSKPMKDLIDPIDGAQLGPDGPPYSIELTCSDDEFSNNPHIQISGFGRAFLLESTPQYSFRCPECALETFFFKEPLDRASAEVWTLGCPLFEILDQRRLFYNYGKDVHTAVVGIARILGPLPKEWSDAWKKQVPGVPWDRNSTFCV